MILGFVIFTANNRVAKWYAPAGFFIKMVACPRKIA